MLTKTASYGQAKKKSNILSLNPKYNPLEFKKYFTLRNFLIILLLIGLYFIIPKYVQAIGFMIFFYPICVFTVRTTKYVKGMGIETITPFTIFLGYLYGWKIALFFGFGIGTYIWAQAGMNQKTLLQCLTNALSAFLGYWASIWFPHDFVMGYVVAVMIRNIVTFLIFLWGNPDIISNASHLVSDIAWNTILLPVFMNMLFKFVMFISPH